MRILSQHVDRYFILLEQTLLILSVSQRMSAFKFEGRTSIKGINATRLADTEKIKNAFEVTGPSIERIIAICQSATEANKWVELLSKNSINSSAITAIDIKRNTSFTSGAHLNVSNLMILLNLILGFFFRIIHLNYKDKSCSHHSLIDHSLLIVN